MSRPNPRERLDKRSAQTLAQPDTQSRAKAENALRSTQAASPDDLAWPRNADQQPLVKITMTAAELIPTGQYANVSVGPAQVTAYIDPHRVLSEDDPYFSPQERDTLARALNELAEVVESDVIAVQRALVLDSLQSATS